MARFDPDDQATALGEALAALRRAAGLSQAEAGARIGMTSQGWGLYETGRRPGLFRPDVQRRLTGALGASTEDLALRLAATREPVRDRAAAAPAGVGSGGRPFAARPAAAGPPSLERLQLTNDDLAPWAASGVILEVDPARWPRRDQGCVVDLVDGGRLVRLYERADGERLHLRGGPLGLDERTAVERRRVARVAAVRARIDE